MDVETFGPDSCHFLCSPFGPVVDSVNLFQSAGFREAVEFLVDAVLDRQSFIALTGVSGIGKTTALNAALSRLKGEAIRVIRVAGVSDTPLTLSSLMEQVLSKPAGSLTQDNAGDVFEALTLARHDESQIVLTIDDCHFLQPDVLPYILLMSTMGNLGPLQMQVILVGQSEFWQTIESPEVSKIADRISRSCIPQRLSNSEAAAYIHLGLKRAGSSVSQVMMPSALAATLRQGLGIPGRINCILNRSFDIGAERFCPRLIPEIIDEVAADLQRAPEEITADDAVEHDFAEHNTVAEAAISDPPVSTPPLLRISPVAVADEALPVLPLRITDAPILSTLDQDILTEEKPKSTSRPWLAGLFVLTMGGAIADRELPRAWQQHDLATALLTEMPAAQEPDTSAGSAVAVADRAAESGDRALPVQVLSLFMALPEAPSEALAFPKEIPTPESPAKPEMELASNPDNPAARMDVPTPTEIAAPAVPPTADPSPDTYEAFRIPPEPAPQPVPPKPIVTETVPPAEIVAPLPVSQPPAAHEVSGPAPEPVSQPAPAEPSVTVSDPPAEAVAPIAPPAAVVAPVPPKPAAPTDIAPPPSLSPALVEALMTRGQAMIALGDVLSARLLYERAAANNGRAATAAGTTYDPLFLAEIGSHGIRPDPVAAMRWYRKAIALGSTEASQRLLLLAPMLPRAGAPGGVATGR